VGKTFELVAETGPEAEDFDDVFATTEPDAERALDGVHDAANLPLDKEPEHVVADLKEVLARLGGTRSRKITP
jgi:hypothetical protein